MNIRKSDGQYPSFIHLTGFSDDSNIFNPLHDTENQNILRVKPERIVWFFSGVQEHHDVKKERRESSLLT
jgi:hypothetical protein